MDNERLLELEETIKSECENMASIVVSKNGKKIYEKYFNEHKKDEPVHVYSVTKSVFCTLLGIAIDKGYLASENQKISEFFPEYKGSTTIKEILTMTAPYKFESEPFEEYFMSKNWVKFALESLDEERGPSEFMYSPVIGVQVLAGILNKVLPKSIIDFANENLFSKLGFTVCTVSFNSADEQLAWYNKQHNVREWVVDPQKINTASWGLTLSAEDMAKVGELYLNNGVYNNQQIISATWIDKCTQEHSRWKMMNLPYGYLWWVYDKNVFAAVGDGGNVIYVNRKSKLVVAVNSDYMPNITDRVDFIRQYVEPVFEDKKDNNKIVIRNLRQNNLKNVNLEIPKGKIVVFTGVSGSGKSSIVFDTIAAESQRQMNETYSAFIRGRLPKYEKPKADLIENLSASVVIDQSSLGGNARSTVGTISEMYSALRVLFSRIGTPYVGTASCFSFNNPNGMCETCSGIGKVTELDIESVILENESWNTGMVDMTLFRVGSWYWQQYHDSGLFDPDKKWKDYTEKERNLLLYGAEAKGGERVNKKVEGIYNQYSRLLLKRDLSDKSEALQAHAASIIKQKLCPDCQGKRLNKAALSCTILGYNIAQMCDMEFSQLRKVLRMVHDPRGKTIVDTLIASLSRMIDIGLPYLSMNRETLSLSGGEAQRVKLVRYMGSSLTGMTYIFDEPSTGMHPRDVHRMTRLLENLRDKGNTVLVVEHDKDVISIADEVIDVGPHAGRNGGQILFQGSYEDLLVSGTLTGNAMNENLTLKENPKVPTEFLKVENASIHNLKNVSVDIPLNVLTVVTGVAGSGKSSLIRDVFAEKYEDKVVLVDQTPITATGRSTPSSYLGFFDEIRKSIAKANGVDASLFSFNSKGACPACNGKGVIVTELVFMDPVVTECEECGGSRYNKEALSYSYNGKNIIDILNMSVEEALEFWNDNKKISKILKALMEVGLPYLSLGQPLSTLSGGERQRIKLAKYLDKKSNIYILDEPTTGLHASDIKEIMKLLSNLVDRGNTVIVIEHNLDVMKQADYIIDIGPDGGTKGGEVVFCGSPQKMVSSSDTITAKYLKLSL